MSIIKLSKITWCGLARDKEKALQKLQALGCLHIIPLSKEIPLRETAGPLQQIRESLQFLFDTPVKRRQSRDPKGFDPVSLEKEILELRDATARLKEERDTLSVQIAVLAPWGQFEFLALEEMKGLRFWFYAVPHKDLKAVTSRKGVWKVVKKDPQFSYIVVIAKEEPEDMPVARVHTGTLSLAKLEQRLEEVEVELEALDVKKLELTRWCDLYLHNFFLLENQAERAEVAGQTFDKDQLFAIQAWAPKKQMEEIRKAANEFNAALTEAEPGEKDAVPTLLENPPLLAGGEGLVTFYMTPGYRLWDPSIIVFFSFAIFFALIISDAGYSLLLSLPLIWKWKAMGQSAEGKKMRSLLAAVFGASIYWGMAVGSYLGITPPKGSFLAKFKWLDINDAKTMVLISISFGIFHICLANAMDAWNKRRSTQAFVPLGWIFIIFGGYLFWLSTVSTSELLKTCAIVSIGLGALLQALFAAPDPNIFKRIFFGIFSLTRVSSAFGDVLSYLRLFALGLAGASLAVTFNGLARQIMDGMPGIGIVFAALIFIFGHALNLVLSIMSGVVHGLRLNVIEFFNWSMYSDGRPFRPFVVKKGGVTWTK